MKIPSYLVNFKCIGGRCEDNCCIGWDVDIDKKTYQKYLKVEHPVMKRELKRYVKVNPDVYNDSINYAFAILDERKHCSFLNADHLCIIQKHLGESYLSNVCQNFPRITNIIDGQIERSATPSCPEVMRYLVEMPDAMQLINVADPSVNPIVTYNLNQNEKKFKGKLLSKILPIRNRCLSLLEDESIQFEQRLVSLSNFVVAMTTFEKKTAKDNFDRLFTDLLTQNYSVQPNNLKASLTTSQLFYELSEMLIEHVHDVGVHDSERFLEFSKIAENADIQQGESVFNDFFDTHSHIFKNLFQNHIFKNLFPFSEGENPEEALWLLLCRYAILKRQLIGIAGYYSELKIETVISYIQVFSKVIEHHKHFEAQTIQTLKLKNFNTNALINAIL